MRLRQLARKIDLQPDQIVAFLREQHIEIINDDNARVEDSYVSLVIDHFAPGLREVTHGKPETQDAPAIEEPFLSHEEPRLELPGPIEKVELIRAPKVELTGLKVVGKIDLPGPKKKEGPAELQPPEGETPARPRQTRRQHPEGQRYPRKNPVTLQREREARLAEEKREEDKKRLKEQKSFHYQKKMSEAKPIKAARKIWRDEVADVPVEKVAKPAPKTAWGKFMRWLNT